MERKLPHVAIIKEHLAASWIALQEGGWKGRAVRDQCPRAERMPGPGRFRDATYIFDNDVDALPPLYEGWSDVSVSEGGLDERAGVARHGEAWRGVERRGEAWETLRREGDWDCT